MPFNFNQAAYTSLRDHYAERRRPIVFWVGAGLSVDAGLPTWLQLRKRLVDQAMETVNTWQPAAAREAEDKLEIALAEKNLWKAFQEIKDILGDTEFRENIKTIFETQRTGGIPDIYYILWGMKNISGILTLNIDGFTIRAHSAIRGSEEALNFDGRDARNYVAALSAGKTFVANLHGQKDNYSSWVFTTSDLAGLIKSEGYEQFIEFIFSSMTVVFLGISADDVAAGGFLERLTAKGLDVGPHFWITDRTDLDTHSWSSKSGVRTIRYSPERDANGRLNHAVGLAAILNDMRNYVSKDVQAKPVVSTVSARQTIPSVRELRVLDEDEARSILAGHAKTLLEQNENRTTSSAYREFLKAYSPAIHQAWHLTAEEPYNQFFGYSVIERLSNSTFSNVWRLTDGKNNNFALKVIQIDNLHSGTQIDSFRRGVQSLTYLTKADVPGTPKLIEAHEIPSSVLMTYVEGQNLADIVKQRDFFRWRDGMQIVINVCKHLEYSHNLPQGVLHRDVRPSNIMIPDYHWADAEAADHKIDRFRAVLLNYDMSWHVNAKGQTIAGNLDEAGFYAPELLDGTFGDLARRTSVDSYGVGMTLYYVFTGIAPPTGGSKSTDWKGLLEAKFRTDSKISWRSAPTRLRRIIADATSPDEGDRANITNIRSRLEMLFAAVQGRFDVISVDLWAEELISRALQSEYDVQAGENEFVRNIKMGRTISCRADFKRSQVHISFSNIGTEATDRVRAARSWGEKLRSAQDILVSGGWEIDRETQQRGMQILLTAHLPVDNLRSDLDGAVKILNRGLDQVRLD